MRDRDPAAAVPTFGERAEVGGRALSQPFVAPMWLIRKNRVRCNIA
jgi:hypothetical protein